MFYKFKGIWITPENRIIHTDGRLSHSDALKNMNLYDSIKKIAKTLDWTQDEIDSYMSEDVAYVAFRLGFIRITSFMDQVGVEFGRINDKSRIDIIKNEIESINPSYKMIVAEKFQTENVIMSGKIEEIINFLYKFD